MKITLDVNALTFGDLEDYETTTGSGLMEQFGKIGPDGDLSAIRAKDLVALIWVCGRQTDPEFTLDDARKVRIDELEVDEAEAADPTPGSD